MEPSRNPATACRFPARFAVATVLLCGALPIGAASAQRNGDVSGGMNNQPTRAEVQGRERASGVAPPPARQQQQAGTVDTLYRDLMHKERADGMTNSPAEPVPSSPVPASPTPAQEPARR